MSGYHWGSLALQERIGVRERAEHVGRSVTAGIRDIAAAFLAEQPHLVVGAADGAGLLWASLLTGPPGFVRATGRHRIAVAGGLPQGDPLTRALATDGTRVGTISLDPRTRRRMRLNGTLEATPEGFAVAAEEVFANCPKYLQKRRPLRREAAGAGVLRRGEVLTPDQERAVRGADTFFVATTGPGGGVDASHRGGLPGFVEVHSPGELSWPDYAGNAMFLTLGNLVTDPRAGLLFPDWESGAVLQLSGRAETLFGADGDRRVRFLVDSVVEGLHPGRLLWSTPEYSPHLGSTTR